MQKYHAFAQEADGDLITSGTATVRVTLAGTDTLATIYDSDSLSDAKANPFTLPVDGLVEFYARNGDYRVKLINGVTETLLDDVTLSAGITYGLLASRPAAGSADRIYIATDTGQMFYDDESQWNEIQAPTAAGKLIQYVETTSTATDSTGADIPDDNTIPQDTEGKEYFTVVITPTDAASKLRVRVFLPVIAVGGSGSREFIGAIFRDADANAIAAGVLIANTAVDSYGSGVLEAVVTAGSTSATTFKFRYGANGTDTAYIGSNAAGNARLSSARVARISVEELS